MWCAAVIRRLRTWFTAVCLLSLAPTAFAAPALPLHRITMSFDLDKHGIHGSLEATIPQEVPAIRVGQALHLESLSLNGKPLVSSGGTGRIPLPPHPDGSVLLAEYDGTFTEGSDPTPANLVTQRGACLTGDWYPAAESALSRFSLRVLVPPGFHAVSEADSISVTESGKGSLVTFDFPHPVPGIHLVMAPYMVTRDRFHSIEISTYLLAEEQGFAEKYLAYTRRYLEMYENMLGPYPFRRFAVVENILPTGYGMPTFTLLGRQVLKLPFIPETSLGHEILHTWFGNSVYVDYGSGNWSEGLTSYLADQYYAVLRGEGAQYRKNIIEEYESYVHRDNEITVREFVSGEDQAMRAVGYGKAAMIFHMLKDRIGPDAFGAGLKMLVRKQKFKITSWEDLQRIFSQTSGQDLLEFFRFWLNRKGAMEITAGRPRVSEAEKAYRVELPLRVANAPLPERIPISVITGAGSEKRTALVRTPEQTFTFSVDTAPQELIIDPDYDLFRSLSPSEKRPLWSRLLGDPTRTLALPEKDQEMYEPLLQDLRQQGFQSMPMSEVTRTRLRERAYLFFGSAPEWVPEFSKPKAPQPGFSLEIKGNPLSPRHVIGLIQARDGREVQAVVSRLLHYGQYSKLQFMGGKNVVKEEASADTGLQVDLPPPIMGIPDKAASPLSTIVTRVSDRSIVYVGERHDRYGDHLMQLEAIRSLRHGHPDLAIGMEMFQSRYQGALDDYIAGRIDEQTFLRRSHYFTGWGFNYFLYRDILLYAREWRVPVVALNIPHDLVSKVARLGLANLSKEERALLPKEMDFSDQAYRERLRQAYEMHTVEVPGGGLKDLDSFVDAQILWDESMATAIADYLAHHPDCQMVVLAGTGHLEFGSGIPKRAYRRSGKAYAIILPYSGAPLEEGLADYIVFPGAAEAPEAPKLQVAIEAGGQGLTVKGFSPGSGAREAGMEEGDVIVGVNGGKVADLDDLQAFLLFRQAGERVRVTVLRGAEKLDFTVELKAHSSHFSAIPFP
jgi:aminopeptidase N